MSQEEKSTLRLAETSPRSQAPKLTAIQWLCSGASHPRSILDRPRLSIGRGNDVDIALDAAGVSRRQAELQREGPIYALRDLGSTNGTYLNGERVQHTAISEGDVLRFGDMVGLVVRVAEDATDTAAEPREVVPGVVFGPGLADQLEVLERVARSDLPIAIVGPTGVGKECVAHALHALSGRSGAYQAVNCAAMPPSLAESELFGHRKGAFTGAEQAAPGHFRAAHGGTLLLDELGDLPAPVQAKLLRVLQEGRVTPLGETRAVSVDVRVLSACQQPLAELVESKRLRADLVARLSGLVIEIPPLRDRRADIPLLFGYFLHRHSGGRPPAVEPRLLEQLLLYGWPANVRELELLARRLLALHGHLPALVREHLPEAMRLPPAKALPTRAPPAENRRDHDLQRLSEELLRHDGNLRRAAEAAGISRQRAYRLLDGRSVEELMAEHASKSSD